MRVRGWMKGAGTSLATALLVAACAGEDPQGGALTETAPAPSEPLQAEADRGLAKPASRDALTWAQQPILTASDAGAQQLAGWHVAVSGDTAVVGAPGAGANQDSPGAAYVFVRAGGTWSEQQKLVPNDGAAYDGFGRSVAIDGDTIVVGAFQDDDLGEDSGSAYVFVRVGGTWTLQQKLLGMGVDVDDEFGTAVAVSGDTAAVGAPHFQDSGQDPGSVHVFVRAGGVWTQQQKLVAADGAIHDQLGRSVALSGDTLVTGAFQHDDLGAGSGSAYVFVRSGVTWAQQQKLVAADGAAEDKFGWSVALHGDTAVVGAYGGDDGAENAGSAYVYVRSGATWAQEQKLLAGDPAFYAQLGSAVAVWGDMAVIGAWNDDDLGAGSGSAYVFTRTGATWTEAQKLTASDGAQGDNFGWSIASGPGEIVVGSHHHDGIAQNNGASYVFELAHEDGDACTSAADCASGHCVDGVCCDAACGDGDPADCQACSVAAGAQVDGVCAPVPAGTVCREVAAACDAAEVCTGDDAQCPADAAAPDGTPCADGVCAAGVCTGEGGAVGVGGGGGAGGVGGGGAAGGAGGMGGGAPSGTGGASPDPGEDGGCGCRMAGAAPESHGDRGSRAALWLGLGLGLALRRRRAHRA